MPTLTAARLKILAVLLCVLTAFAISMQPQTANDFWLQAKVGESIVSNHQIPATLTYPFTEARDFPFHAHEWLASVVFYEIVHTLGEAALPLVLGALGWAYFALVYRLAALRSGPHTGFALWAALVALLSENFRHLLRPELLALLVAGGFLLNLEYLLLRPRWWRWSVALLLSVLWANTHGSFILAPVLVGIYAVGHQVDRWRMRVSEAEPVCVQPLVLLVLAALCSGMLLLNPWGVDLVRFALYFSSSSYMRNFVVEWFGALDPRLSHVLGVQLNLLLAAALTLAALVWARRLRGSDWMLLGLVLLLSLHANRFLVYLGFCLALILPALAQAVPRFSPQLALGSVSVACCAVLLYAAQFGNVNGNFPFRSRTWGQLSPQMQGLLENPALQGPVYCTYDFGAELVYRAYPRLQPSIDSRIDSYGQAYFDRHEALLQDRAAMAAFIARYQVRLMLLTVDDFSTLQQHQVLSPQQWRVLANDEQAVLLVAI